MAFDTGLVANARSDTARANKHPDLDRVMHIFDVHWHGIRSATAALPGHKVGISHQRHPDGDGLHFLFRYIDGHGISQICLQAASPVALDVARLIKREFGTSVRISAVTHVSSAQFGNHFEMEMLAALVKAKRTGVLHRLGSVKPRFSGVNTEFWPEVLVNAPPQVATDYLFRDVGQVLCPVENNWRKNLYTNLLGALSCPGVTRVLVVNEPTGLEQVADLARVVRIPFLPPIEMLSAMSSSAAILHASLIECQPMTELEGMSVGTPSITAPIGIHSLIDEHPLSELTVVPYPDDVAAIRDSLRRIMDLWEREPRTLWEMVLDMSRLRLELSTNSYLNFLA